MTLVTMPLTFFPEFQLGNSYQVDYLLAGEVLRWLGIRFCGL